MSRRSDPRKGPKESFGGRCWPDRRHDVIGELQVGVVLPRQEYYRQAVANAKRQGQSRIKEIGHRNNVGEESVDPYSTYSGCRLNIVGDRVQPFDQGSSPCHLTLHFDLITGRNLLARYVSRH